jgi:acyl-homoserine lactone acylase PvdQ
VLPPGNGNVAGHTAGSVDDQRVMYDAVENPVADGTLTDANLGDYFVDNHLGSGTIVRVDVPRPGVRVEWDSHAIPHVIGDTSDDVAFGAGWAVAESRLLIAEIGRLLGRAGTLELGGSDIPTAIARIGELEHINYTDEELEAGLDAAVTAAGPDGPRILSALDAFVGGLNHWLDLNTFPPEAAALGLKWRHWNRADVLAVGIVVDDIFGAGGGDETGNAAALQQLVSTLGSSAGRATFDDLRSADDPAATSHTAAAFPFPQFARDGSAASPQNTVDPAAVAMPDEPVPTQRAGSDTPTMSNYIAVAGDHTASGHPILVGGPQSSYFSPELLFEMELRGGGYDARGITFPGLGPWVVIGRSRSYAWTATAGHSDLTDQRVELLCEPDGSAPTKMSMHYEFDGQCLPMTRPTNDDPWTAWRTVHGIVVGRSTVGGRPVAISRQRMSRFQTAHAAPAFWKLNQGEVTDAADFAPTMSDIPMSFNWLYVNQAHIAYFHSGWYPVRARGVDPDLPSWGTGEWEWQGRLDWHRQPQQIDPASGYAVSWNNKVAPGWAEPDNNWDSGSIQRVDLLAHRTEALLARKPHAVTPADVFVAAQDAATVDARGELVLPEVLAVLATGPAPNAELGAARDLLARWSASGAHRRDRADDGFYDDMAVPLMDALFEPLVRAVFTPGLGKYMAEGVRRPSTIDNPPSQTGGAFAHGWFTQVADDLRRVRGAEPTPSSVPAFCGGGDLDACRNLLWVVLDSARRSIGPLPRLAVLERIRFIPWVTDPQSVRWMNRPTYQQIIQFGG